MKQNAEVTVFSDGAAAFLQAINGLTKEFSTTANLSVVEVAGVLQVAANRAFFVCTPEFDLVYPGEPHRASRRHHKRKVKNKNAT